MSVINADFNWELIIVLNNLCEKQGYIDLGSRLDRLDNSVKRAEADEARKAEMEARKAAIR